MSQKGNLHNSPKLKEKFNEIYSIEPNDLSFGFLTRLYKQTTGPLKKMPFLYIVPLALIFAICLYILFGHLVVGLVSLLQYGS